MAKLSDIRPGDKLRADAGFSCIEAGRICEVHADDRMNLYVECCGKDPGSGLYDDKHFLDCQVDDDDGEIVGFELVKSA